MRRDLVKAFMDIHVTSVLHLVCAGIFPSYKTAWRWIQRQTEKSGWAPRYIGGIRLTGTGRKVDLYCNSWSPNPRTFKQEVLLTDELLVLWRMGFQDMLRGPKVDPSIRTDATVLHEGKELHFEMDTGVEGINQVQTRMEIVGQFIEPVIWIVLNEQRLQDVVNIASDNSWVKTYGGGELFNRRGEKVPYEHFLQQLFGSPRAAC